MKLFKMYMKEDYNLDRFIEAQDDDYSIALREVKK